MKYTELAGPIGVRARFQALAQHYNGKDWYSADDLAELWNIDKVTAAQAAAYMVKKGWLRKTLYKRKVPKFQPMLDIKENPKKEPTLLRMERFNKFGNALLNDIKDSSLSVGYFSNSQLLKMSSIQNYSQGYRNAIVSAVLIEAVNRGLLVKEVYGYRLPESGE